MFHLGPNWDSQNCTGFESKIFDNWSGIFLNLIKNAPCGPKFIKAAHCGCLDASALMTGTHLHGVELDLNRFCCMAPYRQKSMRQNDSIAQQAWYQMKEWNRARMCYHLSSLVSDSFHFPHRAPHSMRQLRRCGRCLVSGYCALAMKSVVKCQQWKC